MESFSRVKGGCSVKVTPQLYVLPRIRMSRAIHLFSPYSFMAYHRINLLITKIEKG
jgi:hypothetical protein